MYRIIYLMAAFLIFTSLDASAFWGSEEKSDSGLDLKAGYDANTVITVSGKLLSPASKTGNSEHTEMKIESKDGVYTVVLGPWSYWEKSGYKIENSSEISVTGSKAVGKNGEMFIFAKSLETRESGVLNLRNNSGVPNWSRANSSQSQRNGTGRGGAGFRGGSMRGSGGRR